MISRTKDLFQEIQNPDDQYNHIGMDGGKFMLKKEEVIRKLLKCREYGVLFVGLVPFIRNHDKCKFFFDVDHLAQNQTIEDVMSNCMKVLHHKYEANLLTKNYITKSKSLNRYHVYLPEIILQKQSLRMLWDEINDKFINDPIDISASALRYDGFWRFDSKKTRRFLPNTDYVPYKNKFKLDEAFYSDTYLLVNDDTPISKMKSKFAKKIYLNSEDNPSSQLQDNNSIDFTDSMIEQSQKTQDDDSTLTDLLSLNTQPQSSQNDRSILDLSSSNTESVSDNVVDNKKTYGVQTKIEELVNGKYSFLNHCFRDHTIQKIIVYRENQENENVVFSCGKSVKDRTCPFTGTVHRQNNVYFVYQTKNGILKKKCQSSRCKNKWDVVYDKFNYFDELIDSDDEMDDNEDDELWTDSDLAEKYLEFNPRDIMYSTIIKSKKTDGMFFFWNKDIGIWEQDIGMYKLKRQIAGKFRQYMKRYFKDKIKKCRNQAKRHALCGAKAIVNSKLGDYSKIGSVINALKTGCRNVEQLDSNDFYLVCKNGVYDLIKQETVKPQRDEYVTNCRVTNFNIEKKNDEDIEYLFENLIKKLFPDEEQRETQLTYIATILNGKTLKKILINLGTII